MRIKRKNLRLYESMQKYKKIQAGKTVYDFDVVCLKYGEYYGYGQAELPPRLWRTEQFLRKRYSRIIKPEGHPLKYLENKCIVGYDKKYCQLRQELKRLLFRGAKLRPHLKKLSDNKRLPKRIIEREAYELALQYQGLSPKEFEAERKVFLNLEEIAPQLKNLCAEIRLLIKQGEDPKTHIIRLQEICGWSKKIVKGYCDKIPEWDKKQKAKEIKTSSNFL